MDCAKRTLKAREDGVRVRNVLVVCGVRNVSSWLTQCKMH
jgi:hypothetical protein